MMNTIVQKFGGTSLLTETQRAAVVERILRTRTDGFAPVVVVSALGRLGDPYATDSLLRLAVDVSEAPRARSVDLLLSCGEIIAAVVLAETLHRFGCDAVALSGAQCGIITDKAHGRARVLSVKGERLQEALQAGHVPVVAGFQGITDDGDVTTLGRGGSDTTAVVLGSFLHAECVEIYTDVDGVKTADPKLFPRASTIEALTYREIMEMAHLGTRVLHPRAVEIAAEQGLVIKVLSASGGKQTIIGPGSVNGTGAEIHDRVVTGIAHMSGRAQVQVTGTVDFNRSKQTLRVFDAMSHNGISVDLIYVSPDRIAFIIDEPLASQAQEALVGLELESTVQTGFAKVSVVGAGMHGVPGVMLRVVRALDAAGVDIFQTTDSHANISCLIREEKLAQAVEALHTEFQLGL